MILKNLKIIYVNFLLFSEFYGTLNQTLQAKSKTVHEILTQSTVCLIKLEEKKSKYQSFFNKMVERATVFKINAPEAMVLNENDRANKRVVIVTSTQKKRKANSGTPVNQTRQAMSALQALTEINDVPVEYDIFEKMYKESFSLYIKYIQERFDEDKLKPLIAIYDLICDEVCLFDVKKSLEIYSKVIDFQKLKSEILTYYEVKKVEKLKNFEDILNFIRKSEFVRETYTQIVILMKIYLTCGLVSVECERGFSCMERIKSTKRNTMTQVRLGDLAVLNYNSEFISKIDLDECINIFNGQFTRKVRFA